MSITSLRISGSGLTAERARLDAISRNIANVETTRRADGQPGPYLRQYVPFEAITSENGQLGGVKLLETKEFSKEDKALKEVFMPGHVHADRKTGILKLPNVDIIEEMVDMIAATRAYEANIGAANATKSMIAHAIELGRL